MEMKTPWGLQLSSLQSGGEVVDADGSYLFSFSATQVDAVSFAVKCVNACAGINPEAVPELTKLFPSLLDEAKESLDAIGGCDHAVGICCCGLITLIEDSENALSLARKGVGK